MVRHIGLREAFRVAEVFLQQSRQDIPLEKNAAVRVGPCSVSRAGSRLPIGVGATGNLRTGIAARTVKCQLRDLHATTSIPQAGAALRPLTTIYDVARATRALELTRDRVPRYDERVDCELVNFFVRWQKGNCLCPP